MEGHESFEHWWLEYDEADRDPIHETRFNAARAAWQAAPYKTLPCGHPAACGEPCGWCAAVAEWTRRLCDAETVLNDIFVSVKHDYALEAKIEAYFEKQEPRP
jgi:hypothetical protein